MNVHVTLVVACWMAASGARVAGQGGAASLEPLVTEGIINASPAEVWRVFATPEGFKRLGVAQCDMDFRIGGNIRTHYGKDGVLGDEGTIHNEILAFDPERMLSIRIQKPPKRFPFEEATWKPTWSVTTLTDLGDGRTHLRLVGLGYPATDQGRKMRDFFKSGNAWVFEFLKKAYDTTAPPPAASAHPATQLSAVTHERVVARPRSEVWKALATSAGWKASFGVQATIELRPGGAFEILFSDDAPVGERGSEGCTVLSFVPEAMLSFTWNAPPKFAHARSRHTFVVIRLSAISATKTRVVLDHLGFDDQAAANPEHRAEWEATRTYFQAAWPKVLDAVAK